jgi:hypothetical protein
VCKAGSDNIVTTAGADNALWIHEHAGYATEYPIFCALPDARILDIFESGTEIQAQAIARGGRVGGMRARATRQPHVRSMRSERGVGLLPFLTRPWHSSVCIRLCYLI